MKLQIKSLTEKVESLSKEAEVLKESVKALEKENTLDVRCEAWYLLDLLRELLIDAELISEDERLTDEREIDVSKLTAAEKEKEFISILEGLATILFNHGILE